MSKATTRDTLTQESVLKGELDSAVKDEEATCFDASSKSFIEINNFLHTSLEKDLEQIRIKNVSGQRYIGIGLSTNQHTRRSNPLRVTIEGFPGNCLANLNDGGIFEIFGNVADDLADTMHSGSIIVHGNVRDVCAQALQGGTVFVRGSVGNRAGLQLENMAQEGPIS